MSFPDLSTTTVNGVTFVSATDLTRVIRSSVGTAALVSLATNTHIERTAGMVALAEGIEEILAKA